MANAVNMAVVGTAFFAIDIAIYSRTTIFCRVKLVIPTEGHFETRGRLVPWMTPLGRPF